MPDYQEVLRPYLYASEADADGEWRAFCPVCEDPKTSKTPSASFNFDIGVYSCFKASLGCPGGGSLEELLEVMDGASVLDFKSHKRQATSKSTKVQRKTELPEKPLPTEDEITDWHEKLKKQDRLLRYVTDERGLSSATIKEFQIGHDGYRYVIPIRDAEGTLVNVRRYDPKKRDQNKMISWGKGYGKARIYGLDTLRDSETVLLVEGEWDRLVGLQFDLPAVTHTAGAMTFNREWVPLFAGKTVYICYDNDDTGRRGAMKVASMLKEVATVYIISLEIDIKGGDLTDFFVKQGRTVAELHEMMARGRLIGKQKEFGNLPTDGLEVSLEESYDTQLAGQPLQMFVSIAGKQNPPYLAPRKIHATCDQDKGTVCAVCPLSAFNGEMIHRIAANDPSLVTFIALRDRDREAALRKAVGARCSSNVEIDVEEEWNVEELFVTNSVEHRDESRQIPGSRRVMNVGSFSTAVNTTVRLVGQQTRDPKDQRALFTAWMAEPTQTAIDKFHMTQEVRERLRIFRTTKTKDTLTKCAEIADDLAANVTHIYGRPELHMAYDAVWHSVLNFRFLGQSIGKGWLEMLVIGDTRTGKSEAAEALAKHYNAGIVKSCEGASFAGIVGGLQQMGGSHWTTSWGVIPLNDRRLVVLDEMSGLADSNVIEQMSSIRSSGKAMITKIAQEETSARTRLIWISNPPEGQALSDLSGAGMTVIRELVKNPEDIARFDFAMAAASEDVGYDMINASQHRKVPHKYTAELCSELVLWAWSRREDQVLWLDGVEQAILTAAMDMGSRYIADPPLIQGANIRIKLARLAVSFAARTFSTNDSGECILVRKKHVAAAVEFLDRVYGMDSFGYLRQSRKVISNKRKAEEMTQQVKEYLRINTDVRNTLLMVGDSQFKVRDFSEFAGMAPVEAQMAVQELLQWKMIRRLSRGMIRMEQAMIKILQEIEEREE